MADSFSVLRRILDVGLCSRRPKSIDCPLQQSAACATRRYAPAPEPSLAAAFVATRCPAGATGGVSWLALYADRTVLRHQRAGAPSPSPSSTTGSGHWPGGPTASGRCPKQAGSLGVVVDAGTDRPPGRGAVARPLVAAEPLTATRSAPAASPGGKGPDRWDASPAARRRAGRAVPPLPGCARHRRPRPGRPPCRSRIVVSARAHGHGPGPPARPRRHRRMAGVVLAGRVPGRGASPACPPFGSTWPTTPTARYTGVVRELTRSEAPPS